MDNPLDHRLHGRDRLDEDALAHDRVQEEVDQSRADLLGFHVRFKDGKAAEEVKVLLDLCHGHVLLIAPGLRTRPAHFPMVAE